jgi:hypothetical protein
MSVVKISTFNLLCNHFILIKPNCAGIMYRRSFTKIVHFVLIMQTKWPEEIHVSDWSKKKNYSDNTWSIGTKICRNDVWNDLYKKTSFFANSISPEAIQGSNWSNT